MYHKPVPYFSSSSQRLIVLKFAYVTSESRRRGSDPPLESSARLKSPTMAAAEILSDKHINQVRRLRIRLDEILGFSSCCFKGRGSLDLPSLSAPCNHSHYIHHGRSKGCRYPNRDSSSSLASKGFTKLLSQILILRLQRYDRHAS